MPFGQHLDCASRFVLEHTYAVDPDSRIWISPRPARRAASPILEVELSNPDRGPATCWILRRMGSMLQCQAGVYSHGGERAAGPVANAGCFFVAPIRR